MHAELIAIGAELLLGEIVDTNSAHIARALREVGVGVRWISTVGDHGPRITEVVSQALRRSPIVITTGGLGPTVDDPTREAIAAACDRALEFRPELWEQVIARFKRFGRYPGENNRKQAYIPEGAIALENPVGTAPCFIVEHAGGALISLPGVPREMEYMLAQAVLPYLREKFQLTHIIKAKILRTVGMGESVIDEKIGDLELLENPVVGLAAHAGQTDIRITATAPSEAEAWAMIARIEERVRQELGDFIYGEGKETLEEVVGRLLIERRQTVAFSEFGSDRLAQRLRALPNRFDFLRGDTTGPNHLSPGDFGFPISALDLAKGAREAPKADDGKADWGIGLIVNLEDAVEPVRVAVTNTHITETRSTGYGGPPALAATWASTTALNLLRLALLKI